MRSATRRSILALLGSGVTGSLAGCLGDGDDEATPTPRMSPDSTPTPTETPTPAEPTPTPTPTPAPELTGDRLFTRWLPAPTESAPEPVMTRFNYFDIEHLLSLDDVLQDTIMNRIEGQRTIPGTESGPVHERLVPLTPLFEPDFNRINPWQVYAGEFDPEAVIASLAESEGEVTTRTTYGDYEVAVWGEGQNGVSVAVTESIFIMALHTLEGEETEVIGRYIDASVGDATRIQSTDSRIVQLFNRIADSTVCSFTYGAPLVGEEDSEEDPYDEDFIGLISSYTVTESETDLQIMYVFPDAETAEAALEYYQSPDTDDPTQGLENYSDVSTTAEDGLMLLSGTIPTTDLEEFTGI